MKILVACEESQAVVKELRRLGHEESYSCDIQECSGGHPEWHLHMDAVPLLKMKWDVIFAFPPCTYLTTAGAVRMYPRKGEINQERYEKMLVARNFFMKFWEADCPKIAIENPTPMKICNLPPPTQVIQPYQFGHPYSKRTCLWLKGLPPLVPTDIVEDYTPFINAGSKDANGNPRRAQGRKERDSKTRSKTFPGIAKAMAEQWIGLNIS